jgi:Spx/MgsR family transcriptional regulator
MLTVYGLKSCDTCRKATKWLDGEGIAHAFKDLRAEPPTGAQWQAWLRELGHETLINRRGTTWRGLSAQETEGLDEARAARLLAAHPALMKRPLFDLGGRRLVGFGKAQQNELQSRTGS